MKRYGLWMVAALLCPALTVSAAPEKEITMEQVVVTATRQQEAVSAVPAFVSVISEEDIRSSTAVTVPDLLRTLPGIQVKDMTGNRRNFQVDMSGFGETAQSNTLVLVDGRRINQADLSGTDWALIPLGRIERIEIIRGGRGSTLYGDNAAGGVINIITRKGDRTEAGVDVRAGSYGTFGAGVSASGSRKNSSFAISGGYQGSDGYRDNSGGVARDLGGNFAYYLGEKFSVNLDAGYHTDKTGLPGSLKESDLEGGVSRTDSLYPFDFANTEDTYVSAGPELAFLDDSLLRVDMSYRNRSVFSYSHFAAGDFEGDSRIHTIGLSPRAVIRKPLAGMKNNLLAGVDFYRTTQDITNNLVFFGEPDIGVFSLEKENLAGYIHDELNLTERFSVSGGYRQDRAEYEFTPSDPVSTEMDENLYTTGVNYRYGNHSHVFANYSKSFRYPVMDELFSFFTNTINTDLQPQTSDDIGVGARHYFTPVLFGSVYLFRIDTKNEIFYNPEIFINTNLDAKSRRDGVELTLTRKFERLSVTGNYTYLDTEILDGRFSGKEIPGVPNHKAGLEAKIDLEYGFSLGINGTYVGRRYFESDFANDFGRQDEFVVCNARLDYTWKKLAAYLIVNNIFNEEYSEYGVLGGFPVQRAYYPSPETNFLVGVSFVY